MHHGHIEMIAGIPVPGFLW